MRTVSIQTRLLAYYSVLALLLAGVAGYAIVQLSVIDGLTRTINSKWLTGTAMLGEMADLLSEIHIDQVHTLLLHPEVTRSEAEAAGVTHIEALTGLKAQYAPLVASPVESQLFQEFDATSNAYVDAHHAFIAANPNAPMASDHVDATLGGLYRAADDDVDALIEANTEGAEKDAAAVDRINDQALVVLMSSAALGLAIAIWMVVLVRTRVSRPLAAITRALSNLAAGDTGISVPGTDRDDEIGEMAKAFEVFRRNAGELVRAHDAAEQAQATAQALARHDALTGLPNRRVFAEKLDEAIACARSGEAVYAVLLLDLDRFKPVNDMHGHAFGDAVLCVVADRLREIIDKRNTVARLGGDEFAVIAEFTDAETTFTESARKLASRIIAAISEPIFIDENRIEIGASLGIADCPVDGIDAESLLRAADIAMYRADRGAFRFFEQSMDEELKARIGLENELRQAVAADEIRPHYQPLITLGDGRLTGFEILARWQHPRRGIVMPLDFIPLAEEIGVIGALTYKILRNACIDASGWPNDLMLSLNVSPIQLRDKGFPTQILAILTATGFAPTRLQVEITETALVTDIETARATLATLQSLGIRIALDDFGTGYSSLHHLRELNFDQIKIDRSFIESINVNPESEMIINAILGLTKSLGLPTTAEGIEDDETLQRMIANGCTYGQGFYFAAAMPANEAATFARHETRTSAIA